MWRNTLRQVLRLPLLAGLFAGMAVAAQGGEINDQAGFFSQEAITSAEREIAGLKNATGKELRIETFATVPDGKAGEVEKMSRDERNRFFDDWAQQRAKREHVAGIYVLISRHPGHVQIEVDRPTRTHGFGTAERNELRDKLLAGFRNKNYDQALAGGVGYVSRVLKTSLRTPAERTGPSRTAHDGQDHRGTGAVPLGGRPASGGGMGWLGWVIVAVVIVLGIRLIGGLFGGGGGYGGGYGPGGGGMMGGFLSGLFGAVAGNWLYHSFFGNSAFGGDSSGFGGSHGGSDLSDNEGAGSDFEGSGGDFDDHSGGGGDFGGDDFGGGGDFGGGDFGGGDFGGGGDF
jgi:uncharacterized protein